MTARENRIPALDALRGIALFGILVVNQPFFFMPEGGFGGYAKAMFPGWPDLVATFVMHTLFEGKFILIFSFLFGWGLHTQLKRGDSVGRYLRRLLGLFLLGLAHAVLLFVGDILVTYAVLGLALLAMKDMAPRRLVLWAIGFWAISVACHALLGLLLVDLPPMTVEDARRIVVLHQTGDFFDIMAYRVNELIGVYLITPLLFMPPVFGMFLLGLAAARQFSADIAAARPLAARIVAWCAAPAVALNVAYGYLSTWQVDAGMEILTLGLRGIAVPLLALIYLAVALFAFNHPRAAQLARILGGEGRMSLSIYVGESVIMGVLALSYGFALYGVVGPAAGLALCIAVYAALMLLSALWLRGFGLGPLEWMLRCLTEGRIVAITRRGGS